MMGRISATLARVELALAAVMAIAITLLILLNVVTRNLGAALFWVDELAIYSMAWMTFLGASAGMHYGHVVAVTVLTDSLPPAAAAFIVKLADLIVVIFALLMVWFCWKWFAPLDLIRHGLDIEAFQATTFNFIYAEPTSTLGIEKFWVWSVMGLFSLGVTIHSIANLLSPSADRAGVQT